MSRDADNPTYCTADQVIETLRAILTDPTCKQGGEKVVFLGNNARNIVAIYKMGIDKEKIPNDEFHQFRKEHMTEFAKLGPFFSADIPLRPGEEEKLKQTIKTLFDAQATDNGRVQQAKTTLKANAYTIPNYHDRPPMLVMQPNWRHIENGNFIGLDELIQNGDSSERATEITCALLYALSIAEAAGLPPEDLKADNVMVSRNPAPITGASSLSHTLKLIDLNPGSYKFLSDFDWRHAKITPLLWERLRAAFLIDSIFLSEKTDNIEARLEPYLFEIPEKTPEGQPILDNGKPRTKTVHHYDFVVLQHWAKERVRQDLKTPSDALVFSLTEGCINDADPLSYLKIMTTWITKLKQSPEKISIPLDEIRQNLSEQRESIMTQRIAQLEQEVHEPQIKALFESVLFIKTRINDADTKADLQGLFKQISIRRNNSLDQGEITQRTLQKHDTLQLYEDLLKTILAQHLHRAVNTFRTNHPELTLCTQDPTYHIEETEVNHKLILQLPATLQSLLQANKQRSGTRSGAIGGAVLCALFGASGVGVSAFLFLTSSSVGFGLLVTAAVLMLLTAAPAYVANHKRLSKFMDTNVVQNTQSLLQQLNHQYPANVTRS